MNTYTAIEIECRDCIQPFIFSAGEQEFYAARQLKPPRRCKPCRQQARRLDEQQAGQVPDERALRPWR